jgi:hypothetical protein
VSRDWMLGKIRLFLERQTHLFRKYALELLKNVRNCKKRLISTFTIPCRWLKYVVKTLKKCLSQRN